MPLSRYTPKYERKGIERALIARFRRRLVAVAVQPRPATVLDAGCGEGFVTQWLREALPDARIVGLDNRAEALREAACRVPHVHLHQADVHELPYPAGAFDLVVCTEVLEHLQGPLVALAELRRVSGGQLLVTVPHEPFFRAGNVLRGRHLGRAGSTPGHRWTWTGPAFRRLAGGDARWFSAFPWQGLAFVRSRSRA